MQNSFTKIWNRAVESKIVSSVEDLKFIKNLIFHFFLKCKKSQPLIQPLSLLFVLEFIVTIIPNNLDISYCEHIDVWCLDRITGEFADTIEYINLSGKPCKPRCPCTL